MTRVETVDTGALYERKRRELVAIVVGLTDAELEIGVPATPAWSVRDVLAHVVGIASDLNAQRFPASDDVGGTAWTDGQVARGRGRTIDDLLSEWEREAPRFEDGLRAFGYDFGSHFVADLHADSQDVRGAVGLTPDADELTVAVALDHYLGFCDELLTASRWGRLEVVMGEESRRLGSSGPGHARVSAPPFEILRVVSGRRSERQIRVLDWDGDVDDFIVFAWRVLASGYAMPDTDLAD